MQRLSRLGGRFRRGSGYLFRFGASRSTGSWEASDLTGEGIAKGLGGVASLVWTGLAVYLVWLLRTPLTGVVNRMTGFEGWGLKFALAGGEQAMAAAFEIAAKNPKWTAEASEQDRRMAIEKAKARRKVLEGAEILW